MTAHTHTIRVSDTLFQRLNRRAEVNAQSVDEVAETLLARQLPATQALQTDEQEADLTQLATFSTVVLERIAASQFPDEREALYDQLLQDRLKRALSDSESEQLDILRHEADQLMLRKARAMALLKERGHDVSALITSSADG